MFLAKLKRFRKKSEKALETHLREKKLKELLEKERRSSEIQIIYGEDQSEVKKRLKKISHLGSGNRNSLRDDVIDEDIKVNVNTLKELEEKIKVKEEQLKNVSNVILKKRFLDSLSGLKTEYEKIKEEIVKTKRRKRKN